ncbi:hypothetical protein [Williamsia sp.]|uniref:hypothetical protein n=1 Tax=Williamsia sp. TaxID=1872085 RepID=UPI002F94F5A5
MSNTPTEQHSPGISNSAIVPMLDDAIARGSAGDCGALRVAITWLWTQFDPAVNAELLEILDRGGLAPPDPSNLNQIDRALHTASSLLYTDLLTWAIRTACCQAMAPNGDPKPPSIKGFRNATEYVATHAGDAQTREDFCVVDE